MADESYRRAFERKPRFLPLPSRARRATITGHGRRRNRGRRTGGRDAGAAARARGSAVELYEAQRFPREKPCGEGIMPAGVAVLERLGLRAAVGGRPLASVRYHGFGMTAESGFAPRADGTAPVVLGQRRLHLDQTLLAAARATPGVRVFEEAPVEGAAIAGGRAVGLRVGGELRRGGLVVGADGLRLARAPLARTGSPRPRRPGASACARTIDWRPAAASPRGSRSSSAAATSCTRRRCPTTSCCWPRSPIATRFGRQRARVDGALDRRAAAAARLAGRRDAADASRPGGRP